MFEDLVAIGTEVDDAGRSRIQQQGTSRRTKDGFERQLGVNHLGDFELTPAPTEPALSAAIQRNRARRDQILSAATKCFVEYGFHGSSMAESPSGRP